MIAFNHTITFTSPFNGKPRRSEVLQFLGLVLLISAQQVPQHVIRVVLQFQKIFTF